MSNQNENVELETTEIEQFVELGEALDRLYKNPDFQKIILEGYFKQKALDSVSLLSMPSIKKRGERGDIMEDLVAISNLQFFFMFIQQQHAAATDPVLSDEEEEEQRKLAESAEGQGH